MIKYFKLSYLQLIIILFFPIIYFEWVQIFLFEFPNYYRDSYDRSFYDIANNFFTPGETSQFHERAFFPVLGYFLGASKSIDTFELYRFLTYLLWAFTLCLLINEKFEELDIYPNYLVLFFIFSLPITYFMFRQGHTKSDTTIILATTLIAFSQPSSIRRTIGIIILTLSHAYFAFMILVAVSIYEIGLYKDRLYLKKLIKNGITFILSYFILTFFLFLFGKGLKIPFIGPDEENTLIQTLVWREGLVGNEFYRLNYILNNFQWAIIALIFFLVFLKDKVLFLSSMIAFTFTLAVNLIFNWNEPRTFNICFFPILIMGMSYIYDSGKFNYIQIKYFNYIFALLIFLNILFGHKQPF